VSRLTLTVLVCLVAAHAQPALAQDTADGPATVTYFDSAKITINARAKADGFMRVRLLPEGGGAAREATVPISRRMRENELAGAIADGLEAALAPDYEADRDAGEHVKLRKAKRDLPNFSVEITFNAPGFSVILDK
jgi:hypothetical protein